MKKILFGIGAIALVVASIPLFAAFEAHVINVTAHIENALKVATAAIEFGTVFPQEYTERTFTVELSDSFKKQERINDVEYKIVQKLKPCPERLLDIPPYTPLGVPIDPTCVRDTANETPHNPTGWHYLDLCRFLSKTSTDANDTSEQSYFVPAGTDPARCQTVTTQAKGVLANYGEPKDLTDTWTVDLKVPPVAGYVGQDWPDSCAGYVVPEDSKTYGCDLWVEVTGFTKDGHPYPPQ